MTEAVRTFGPFTFDTVSGTLHRGAELVPIGHRSAALLHALLEAEGKAVTKSSLMEQAWPSRIVEEGNLTVQISALRKAVGEDLLITVPRIGYRLVLPPAQPAEPIVPALAVLPFQNLTGDAEQEYFADGVVEDIIAALSRFRSFAVVARNTSFIYKGRGIDLRQAALELGVRYLLEGSVRRSGDTMRISAHLVDCSDGTHLWAERFDGAVADVFDFQDRITSTVATLVEPSIQDAELRHSRRERPRSIAAYDLYLKATALFWTDFEQDNAKAFDLLAQALDLDPDNSICLALAAQSLARRNIMAWQTAGTEDRDLCERFVRKSLQNAGTDAAAMAFCADALVHYIKDYDWALATAQNAVSLNPNNLHVVFIAGVVNLHCGEVDDALVLFQRALRANPHDLTAHLSQTGIAHVAMIRGDWQEALVWASRALALKPNNQPTHWILVAANTHLGRSKEAARHLREYRNIAPHATVAGIRAGQPDKYPDRISAILEGLRLAGLPEK